jgi:hypothetical protein
VRRLRGEEAPADSGDVVIDLVSNWIAGSDLEYIEDQDKNLSFQRGGSMVCGSASNSRNESLEGNWRALLDVGGLSV